MSVAERHALVTWVARMRNNVAESDRRFELQQDSTAEWRVVPVEGDFLWEEVSSERVMRTWIVEQYAKLAEPTVGDTLTAIASIQIATPMATCGGRSNDILDRCMTDAYGRAASSIAHGRLRDIDEMPRVTTMEELIERLKLVMECVEDAG